MFIFSRVAKMRHIDDGASRALAGTLGAVVRTLGAVADTSVVAVGTSGAVAEGLGTAILPR